MEIYLLTVRVYIYSHRLYGYVIIIWYRCVDTHTSPQENTMFSAKTKLFVSQKFYVHAIVFLIYFIYP